MGKLPKDSQRQPKQPKQGPLFPDVTSSSARAVVLFLILSHNQSVNFVSYTIGLENTGSIPTSLIAIPGVANLITGGEDNPSSSTDEQSLASDILETAWSFQAQASGPRLSQTPAAYVHKGTSRAPNPNLAAAQKVVAERKLKKNEAKILDSGIRVSACLYQENKGRFEQLKAFQTIERFDPGIATKTAFDSLLVKMRELFLQENPTAEVLTWANINVYTHESQTRFSSLQQFDRTLSLSQLFKNEFLLKKLGSQKKLEERDIEIRFVFKKLEIFKSESEFFDNDSDNEANESFSLGSKRKRATKKSMMPNTGGVAATSNSRLSKTASISQKDSALVPRPAKVYLRSAWKPKPVNSSIPNPTAIKTLTCKFVRTSAKYDPESCEVKLTIGSKEEDIEISTKWENKDDPGYIGEGSTKRGIYARFNGVDYVLTQPLDVNDTRKNVQHVLAEEYKLLCLGHTFKLAFDAHAEDRGIKAIPKFYFNFAESIFGELVPSVESGSRCLPYSHFIATRLLPCGDADPKVKKFTGNEQIGIATDHMTKAIHAFAHFLVVYSQQNVLLCDLQGAPDTRGIMCLIDPQSHTSASPKQTVYWDQGTPMIDAFLEQHSSACEQNWFCKALKLKDLIVRSKSASTEEEVDQSNKRDTAKGKNKSSISFITNEVDQ